MTTAPANTADHVRLTTQAALLSVSVAGVLIALKGWSWLQSGSVGMLASLADSILDLVASLFTFFAVRYAATPPDRKHRYGHGKAEAFAGLVQSGLVAVSGVLIAFEAIRRFFQPAPVTHGLEGVSVMLTSMMLTTILVAYQTQVLQRTKSIATRADRLHYLGDFSANLVVLVGLALSAYYHLPWADSIAALIVAGWLAMGAIKVAGEAGDHLLDRELPDADRERIRALAESDERVGQIHQLRTRSSGPYVHVQFHVELEPGQSLEEAHKIVVAAENRIRGAYPTADVIIHPDPKGRAAPHGHEDFEPRTRA